MIQNFSKKIEKIMPGRHVLAIAIIILSLFYVSTGVMIQQAIAKEDDPDELVAFKQIEGKVSALTSKYITIVYNEDKEKGVENEIFLYLNKEIEVVHRKSLKEILPGDTVRVTYEEKFKKIEQQKDDGSVEEITKIISRTVKKVTLIRSGKR